MGMPCLPLWWAFFHFTYWLSSKGHLDSLHLLSLQWILVFFSYQDILRADSYYLGIFIGYTVIVWCVHRNMKYSYANNWLWFFFQKDFFYVSECSVCRFVCVSLVCLMCSEPKRCIRSPETGWLWAAMLMLGNKPMLSARAAGTLAEPSL